MRTRQKCVATDTWRSLGCRTTPLEHWSRRKPTVEPRWAKQQTKKLRPKPTKINSFMSGPSLSLTQVRFCLFQSISVLSGKSWYRYANELTVSASNMAQTSKQNKADSSVISAFSTQHTYSRPLYSLQICRIGILQHFGTKYVTDFPICCRPVSTYGNPISTFTRVPALCHMRTTKSQMVLRFRAVRLACPSAQSDQRLWYSLPR